uniref:transposase n=1 Tax=Diplocloster modestus TaxID=2850322 RepID=UPI002FE6D094
MGNDQLLPAYNLQTAVCDEYISVVDVKPYASDIFTMFKKETTDKKYNENPYRAVNFKRAESGKLICPNGKKFHFKSSQHVYKNKYGRTEEIYKSESCEGCSIKVTVVLKHPITGQSE